MEFLENRRLLTDAGPTAAFVASEIDLSGDWTLKFKGGPGTAEVIQNDSAVSVTYFFNQGPIGWQFHGELTDGRRFKVKFPYQADVYPDGFAKVRVRIATEDKFRGTFKANVKGHRFDTQIQFHAVRNPA